MLHWRDFFERKGKQGLSAALLFSKETHELCTVEELYQAFKARMDHESADQTGQDQ